MCVFVCRLELEQLQSLRSAVREELQELEQQLEDRLELMHRTQHRVNAHQRICVKQRFVLISMEKTLKHQICKMAQIYVKEKCNGRVLKYSDTTKDVGLKSPHRPPQNQLGWYKYIVKKEAFHML